MDMDYEFESNSSCPSTSASASNADRDDILRGIFDTLPSLGRHYSPFYYYAKYVANHKSWMEKIIVKDGLLEAAELIHKSFNTLSTEEKEVFIQHSSDFHKQVNEFAKPECTVPSFKLHNRNFVNEPQPPFGGGLLKFYVKERSRSTLPLPPWKELDIETQTYYMKKLYQSFQNYLHEYETFVQGLTPPELLTYVSALYNAWENRHLEPPKKLSQLPFVHPLPAVNNEDDVREQEAPNVSTDFLDINECSRTPPKPNTCRPFDNDKFISWLTMQRPPSSSELPESTDQGNDNEESEGSVAAEDSDAPTSKRRRRRRVIPKRRTTTLEDRKVQGLECVEPEIPGFGRLEFIHS